MGLIKKMGSFATSMLMVSAMQCGVPMATADKSSDIIYINEVCTQNKNCFKDSLDRASDWIELYNDSKKDIDLSGYGLSDNENDPMKYVIPSGTIIRKGSYLLIVSAKDSSGLTELNTGFGLDKTGETLILSSPDGSELQKLIIPALQEDTSYGRSSDGSYSVMSPTPESENHSVTAEPVFSLESGFYSENDIKELTISSSDTVYYTLDGSDPTTSETALVYNGAIPMYDRSADENVYSRYQYEENSPYSVRLSPSYVANTEKVDKATIIRAVSESPDGTFSRVTSRTFFVMSDEKLDYYSNIPVVSIVTDPDNLFDKDKGIYVTGQQYIDWLNNPGNNGSTNEAANFLSTGKKWEREAEISYFKNGDLGFSQKMGIRIRGASTRNYEAKSFNLYAKSEYGDSKIDFKVIDDNRSVITGENIKRYDSFGLRAVTDIYRIREMAVHSALKDLPALGTYDSERCMLFIDGELWGMYEITEKASDYYIESNYNVPSENVTVIKNGELEDGPDDERQKLQSLGNFCRDNDLSVPENYEYVTSRVDTESIIDHYCAGLYLGTWDWPNYNYFMWRYNDDAIEGNPYSDGKWRFGSFDFDYSAGLAYEDFGGVESYEHDSFRKMERVKDSIPTIIFVKLLENPEFRQQFADKFYSYAYSVFESSKMDKELNAEEERYMDYMTFTAWRWNNGTPDSDLNSFLEEQKSYYHNAMEDMRTFFRNRAEYAVKNMENYLGISSDGATVTVTRHGKGSISVDSVDSSFSGNVWTGSFESGKSITITAKPDDGYVFAGWTGAVNSDSETITVTADKAVALVCRFKKAEKSGDDTEKTTYDISGAGISFTNGDTFTQTGSEIQFDFTLSYGDKQLVEGVDYEVYEGDRTAAEPGSYMVKVRATGGDLIGELTIPWYIIPHEVSVSVNGEPVTEGVEFAKSLTVNAPAAPEGQKFSHWEANGATVSYSEYYSFIVKESVDLIPVYVPEEEIVDVQPVLTLSEFKTVYNGYNAIGFDFTHTIPEKYTVQEAGLLYATNKLTGADITKADYAKTVDLTATDFDVESAVKNNTSGSVKSFTGDYTNHNGTISFSYAIGDNTDCYVYAVGYIKCIDENGQEFILYTEFTPVKYDTLS